MNLTPNEKAKELVDKYQSGYTIGRFSYQLPNDLQDSKQCALIAVDEILKSTGAVDWIGEKTVNFKTFFDYWFEVKNELEKL